LIKTDLFWYKTRITWETKKKGQESFTKFVNSYIESNEFTDLAKRVFDGRPGEILLKYVLDR
jgi:hypothetical protein